MVFRAAGESPRGKFHPEIEHGLSASTCTISEEFIELPGTLLMNSLKDIDVVAGGNLGRNWFTLMGPLSNKAAGVLFSDIMFIGVDGADADKSLTCVHPQEEAEFLRVLTSHARRKVVVADHSEFGVVSRRLLCPADEVTTIITDREATVIAPFRQKGIEVKRSEVMTQDLNKWRADEAKSFLACYYFAAGIELLCYLSCSVRRNDCLAHRSLRWFFR